MSLVHQTSLISLAELVMSGDKQEFDTLALRNRDVVETFSPVSELGQENKKEFDKLELGNRTVTETLSPLKDLGQDRKQEKAANGNAETNGKDDTNDEAVINPDDYDKLE